jgi:glycosyltransferase involved in cell wall biosynthesis
MALKVAIVTSTYPPDPCGIGDYTYGLARSLGATCEVTIVTNRRKGIPPAGIPVRQVFERRRASTLSAVLPELEALRPDWLLLQYDPYSYGTSHSFNPFLPALLQRARRRFPRMRVGAVVHETFVAPSNVRRALMTSWQRAQLWALGKSSDLLVVVVDAWAKRLRTWFPKTEVVFLPVGNNVPALEVDRATLRASLGLPAEGVILGWLGRGGDHRHELLTGAIRATADAGAKPFVVHLGVGIDYAHSILDGFPSKVAGLLSTEEISRHLSAFDVYLAPISEGISSRRTSIIAALAHRVPVATTVGPATDPFFFAENGRSLMLVDPARGESFAEAVRALACDADLRDRIGREAEAFAERHFSWRSIGEALAGHLASAGRARVT